MKYIWMIFTVVISASISAETTTLCSLERPGLSHKDGTGYYWELLRAVYREEGIEVEHHSAPFKRCLQLVERGIMDGAVAVFHTPERAMKFNYPKSRLNVSTYGLSYLKETSLEEIEKGESRVGIIRGYDFSAWLPSNIKLVSLNNNTQAIGMLKLKRIKYHADDLQDVLFTLKKMGERPDQFAFKSLHTKNLYVLFTRNTRGQKLADSFDAGLKKASKGGELKRLAEEHGINQDPA